jgi:hypothetical protein
MHVVDVQPREASFITERMLRVKRIRKERSHIIGTGFSSRKRHYKREKTVLNK